MARPPGDRGRRGAAAWHAARPSAAACESSTSMTPAAGKPEP